MPVSPEDPLVKNFLAYYARGIWQFFPDFDLARLERPRCIFILRNLLPVGLFGVLGLCVWLSRRAQKKSFLSAAGN